MIKVVICGIGGRMCGRIAHLTLEAEGMELAGGVEAPGNPSVGRDVGEVIGAPNMGVHVVDNLSQIVDSASVVVAFTAPPEPTVEAAALCGERGKPMVVGTTGMSDLQVKQMTDSLKDVACVFAPNFSVGVTVLVSLVEKAARILGDAFDVEIVEAHHHFKKDAPSGTALALAEAAARGLERNLAEVGVYGRHGDTGERSKEEIGIHALRAGDIVGEHTVMFGGTGETIQLVHRAQSRDSFGVGTIRSVKFAFEAKAGLYNMLDVLGMRGSKED